MPRKKGSTNVFEGRPIVTRLPANLPDDVLNAVTEKADALGVPVQAVTVQLLADWAGVESHVKQELADKVVSDG